MSEYLIKNGVDLAQEFEIDYEVGVELCKKNHIICVQIYLIISQVTR